MSVYVKCKNEVPYGYKLLLIGMLDYSYKIEKEGGLFKIKYQPTTSIKT